MTQVQVDHSAIQAAANAAQTAAADAKGHGSAAEVNAVAGSVPGAPSVGYLTALGISWDEEVAEWVKAAAEFGTDLAEAGEDYRSVDASIGGLFGGLGGG